MIDEKSITDLNKVLMFIYVSRWLCPLSFFFVHKCVIFTNIPKKEINKERKK